MPRRPGGPEGLWAPGLLHSYLPLPEFRPLPAWPPSRPGLQLPAPGAFLPCESSELATATSDRVSSPPNILRSKISNPFWLVLPHFLPHWPRPFLSLAWASNPNPSAPWRTPASQTPAQGFLEGRPAWLLPWPHHCLPPASVTARGPANVPRPSSTPLTCKTHKSVPFCPQHMRAF